MIPFNNLPANTNVDWFMQPTATNEVHEWTKPVGCNYVYMIAVGGAGYGGNGFTAAAGSARGGGAGGSSGSIASLLVPAFLITDSLFIRVGSGGINATATASLPTIISAYRISSVTEYYLYAINGTNGGNGNASVPGTGGIASNNLSTNNALGTIGKYQASSTITGAPGGAAAGAAGTSLNFAKYLCTGAGGGGTTSGDFAGGNILSAYGQQSAVTVVQGGAAVSGATAGQNDGGSGFWIPKRNAFYGGAGGGASNTGVGGSGGKGAPGCGGGGGGAGTSGGLGGNGGDGFVVIISY